MARNLSTSCRKDLSELENRLLDHGFASLMSVLPRQLFQMYNERITIIDSVHKLSDREESPAFAYVSMENLKKNDKVSGVHVHSLAIAQHKFSPSAKRKKGNPEVELVRIGKAEIDAFNAIPPLSWHGLRDPGYKGSPECTDHTIALIKYFLLIWASDNNCEASLPQPDYTHLVAAFDDLMATYHYQAKTFIGETDQYIDVPTHLREGEEYMEDSQKNDQDEPPTAGLEKDDTEAGHSARESRKALRNFEKPGDSEQHGEFSNDARLPTPRLSPRESILDVNMVDSAEGTTRAASVASETDSANGAQLTPTGPLDTDVVMTLAAEELARQSLPTPDTLPEEAVAAIETDPTLKSIYKTMGREAVSLLPILQTCTFKKIHTSEPGYLSLRILLGTLHDTSQSELDGSELWASFKMHDKSDRAAPRMHVHAFRANTDQVIRDGLKVKDILPDLKPVPAFGSLHGGDRAEELLLKALVKYFFIIAAKDKLLGFDKHKMPYNGSFVDQLKIACKRLQISSQATDDQDMQTRPVKRQKRIHIPTLSTPAPSDPDEDAAHVFQRTRDARRSGRRTGQPSSAAVSEDEDNIPASFTRSQPPKAPRKLAVGKHITKGMEGPALNEFLDPNAEPADSDGESGDEIPAPIPADIAAFLKKRSQAHDMAKDRPVYVKEIDKRIKGKDMGKRKIKGLMNKEPLDSISRQERERQLVMQDVNIEAMGRRKAVLEDMAVQWKKRVKEVDAQAAIICPRVIETWKALQR